MSEQSLTSLSAMAHASTTDHERGTTYDPVDYEESHEAGEEFPCQRAGGEDLGESCTEIQIGVEGK